MNILELIPPPQAYEAFRRNSCIFVPQTRGCYVLTTFLNEVLYIGQAVDLRRRMTEHLDTPEKIRETPVGRAIFFHWLAYEDIGMLERTWMNINIQHEGRLPVLNKVYSPVST
jgi:hypothetical protein